MKVKAFQFAPVVKCLDCSHVGKSRKENGFSGCLFIVLLFFGIVPGFIYLFYKEGQYEWVCKKCDSKRVVPVD